ncbi:MAG: response regulator, partial [Planctomycetota bacterium]
MRHVTKNVLIVDDDPRILRSLRNGFRRQPLRVLTAASAVKAMEVLGSERIDAVVCDQRMPGASGIDLLECVARESPQTVRVMLSGDGRFTTALEAINRAQVAAVFGELMLAL